MTTRLVNALSIDVEDWFQVQALAGRVSRDDWDRMERRVERNTERILSILDRHALRATFFTLGWVAQRSRAIIRRIVAEGHELACHGLDHTRVDSQTPEQFRADIRRAKRLLEDAGGVAVRGYRAATFSVGPTTPWAWEVLADEGFAYSSSVCPVRHDLYGMPDAPRFAYRPLGERGGIEEIPVSTIRVLGRTIPCGGGGWFRILPYAFTRAALGRINQGEGRPCVFYLHPWELDPGQPRLDGLPWKARFRHYANLDHTEARFVRLLGDFAWDRVDRVFGVPVPCA
ncbi:MAG: DUF3473 domain-containing protein [Alphaproteobacteria bacterium]|nr:DUF3473 domain-containing protein [Alphaproteobacteria bacterium]